VFQPNTANADSKHKADVNAIFSSDHLRRKSQMIYSIDINDVLYHINKLEKQMAAGIDLIVNEHVIIFGG